jgi:nitroreductase
MDFFETMESRISQRAFLPKKVEKATLERILRAANRSPSYMNTQPWEVFVVTGKKKETLAKKLYEQAFSGTGQVPYIPFPKTWPEALDERSKNHRMRRFKALGIDPDKEQDKVVASYRNNFKFYDAPCAIFIAMDKALTSWSVFDCGAFVHGFLLAAHGEGLGACPQAMPTAYPDAIRAELGIPDTLAIILCISLGYPNLEMPVNQYRSLRRDISEYIHWNGF